MKVYFAADHAGYGLKNELVEFVRSLGYEVEDCGARSLDVNDDYPVIIGGAVKKVVHDFSNGTVSRGIILGASGQGEAMAANRIKGVRAAVYYGPPSPKATDGHSAPERLQKDLSGRTLDILASSREHNNANILSLGSRFLSVDEAKAAVKEWLAAPFSGEERHLRRIRQIDTSVPSTRT